MLLFISSFDIKRRAPCLPCQEVSYVTKEAYYLKTRMARKVICSPTPVLFSHIRTDCSLFDMAEQRDGFIKFTPEFITKTLIGKVKCGQLVFTLLAGACGSSVISYISRCSCGSKFGFFDFVAWTAFINALIDMIIHLLGLWERLLWIFRHPAIHAILCAVAVLGFLIGSSLAASCAKDKCVTSKSTAGAASFFGFVCLVLFAVEAFLQFQEYRGMQEEARHQSSGESKQPDYIEPPPIGVV